MSQHVMYFKEVTKYAEKPRRYKFIAIKGSNLPVSPKLGEDDTTLEDLGQVVANGHRIVVLPAKPNGITSDAYKVTAKGYSFKK